ncbi:M4 family metallopeptidase [Calothrix sp. 336/3]|uniref:M4 family metallopeptidase n=1 Tax=Calothrix sp. 336/3 TaxID=1337936 RepID=UPI0004E39333|nr:M4 family metallopeptidase [Calothrix sp. 336/3]AKG23339.1 peptidase M4 [Calothrix sp. 336/3]
MAGKKNNHDGFDCEHDHQHSRCPICCIVPPHMLENIVVNGNVEQRRWAFHTLNMSAQFRGRRDIIGGINFAPSPGEKRRTIYDAKNSQNLPGEIVRAEGDPPSTDEAINEAYDSAGATYDLYYEIFERNSIDDKGLRLDSTVHYGVKYDNAFWNGDQMVYGDGDGELFQRFTKSIDVIGHELTHGVTQYEAGLIYFGEPGALNESMSDIFGSLVKQRVKNQTVEEADWIIGEGLFTPNVKGLGIRSMKAPGTAYDDPVLGKDPQPAHMKDKFSGVQDNGGVHINSGIPNYAFYLAAMEIGGYAWEKTGKIWYVALCDRLRSRNDFQQAANLIIKVAGELYGEESHEQKAVRNAWQKVGVIT